MSCMGPTEPGSAQLTQGRGRGCAGRGWQTDCTHPLDSSMGLGSCPRLCFLGETPRGQRSSTSQGHREGWKKPQHELLSLVSPRSPLLKSAALSCTRPSGLSLLLTPQGWKPPAARDSAPLKWPPSTAHWPPQLCLPRRSQPCTFLELGLSGVGLTLELADCQRWLLPGQGRQGGRETGPGHHQTILLPSQRPAAHADFQISVH